MSAWSARALESAVGGFHLGPVSFDLADGQTLAVLGPSGSGKTTLLRTLAGLLPAAAGELWRGAEPVTASPPEGRGLGYVPQGLALFPHLSVRGNVGYGLGPAPSARIEELLHRFDLAHLGDRRPSTLSGGEAQRVALARALARPAELLLWDEPLGAVDLVGREAMVRLFSAMPAEPATARVLVTHDPEVAFALADRVLLLEEGRTVYSGPVDALLDRPPSPFAARFAGYDNILTSPKSPQGPFGQWVAEHGGAGGLGVPARAVRTAEAPDGWLARAERVAPRPGGRTVWATVEGFTVVGETGPETPLRRGASWRFTIDPEAVRPIGAGGGSAG